ncbi:MAG: DUF4872 domain-containing protein [Chitinivibrionales bacterium]|nr:DUF4872 domain-containing protein [Chitinivibrionales bacterium]
MNTMGYEHHMAAHCETGTISSLLAHAGLPLSEPMVLGISGGIFFAYLKPRSQPFPMFVVRSAPGSILKNMTKRVKVGFDVKRYGNPQKAQTALDALIERGIPSAVQVDMFYMDYIPAYMRVHFNGHFVTVVGKDGDEYTISDCYHPRIATVPADALSKARFAKGEMAPKGTMFHVEKIPSSPDLKRPVIQGLKQSWRNMIGLPVPFLGVKGIRLFARKLTEWPSLARDEVQLSHEIMNINVILEERGTGGAGFRFMFASFLREAAGVLGDNAQLNEMATEMMAIGDRWRELSIFAARMGKKRELTDERFRELQGLILARADEEEAFFGKLKQVTKTL